jgi:hypothetical protein
MNADRILEHIVRKFADPADREDFNLQDDTK